MSSDVIYVSGKQYRGLSADPCGTLLGTGPHPDTSSPTVNVQLAQFLHLNTSVILSSAVVVGL